MKTFRIFVQDVGKTGYSSLDQVRADNPVDAILPFCTDPRTRTVHGRKLIALPDDRRDLWPNSETGKVSKEALRYR